MSFKWELLLWHWSDNQSAMEYNDKIMKTMSLFIGPVEFTSIFIDVPKYYIAMPWLTGVSFQGFKPCQKCDDSLSFIYTVFLWVFCSLHIKYESQMSEWFVGCKNVILLRQRTLSSPAMKNRSDFSEAQCLLVSVLHFTVLKWSPQMWWKTKSFYTDSKFLTFAKWKQPHMFN